jgi:lysylphosphatidylglycerol synthetase-like protein (DUF2156 family)
MGLSLVFAVLAVAGAAATVFLPGQRRAGLALAATTLLVGLAGLALGAVEVFLVELVAALLLTALVQAFGLGSSDRPIWTAGRELAAAALTSALVLGGLAWVALQPGLPAGPKQALHPVLLASQQLVPLGAAAVLVLAAALAVMTLREPGRSRPLEQSPPRRASSSGARPPREGGRR